MDPRDQTFISIHNLTPDANILFASDSIIDILGYQPDEVRGKSCFDYFHPDEAPFARSVHRRGVSLNKAAALHYARIRVRDGEWRSCECCYTVVHDVLVACTSIYLPGPKSEKRAMDAPHIQRLFSSPPRDPRWSMLAHMSAKFMMPPMQREPRAALILNRFTLDLNIMFATNAVTTILGLRPDEIVDKSFYDCIQDNCREDAYQCLQSAKENESVAYCRFWYRDPRVDYEPGDEETDEDSDSDGGARISDNGDEDVTEKGGQVDECGSGDVKSYEMDCRRAKDSREAGTVVKPSMEDSDAMEMDRGPAVLRRSRLIRSPGDKDASEAGTEAQRITPSDDAPAGSPAGGGRGQPERSFELEAVVSCSSDGLVVVLRRLRPLILARHVPPPSVFNYQNGLFAAPWGSCPIEPQVPPELLHAFRPPLLPQHMPLRQEVEEAGGPPMEQLMQSIRDVAVFAWALVGINNNLANHAHGVPREGAQPVNRLYGEGSEAKRDRGNQDGHRSAGLQLKEPREVTSNRPSMARRQSYSSRSRSLCPSLRDYTRDSADSRSRLRPRASSPMETSSRALEPGDRESRTAARSHDYRRNRTRSYRSLSPPMASGSLPRTTSRAQNALKRSPSRASSPDPNVGGRRPLGPAK